MRSWYSKIVRDPEAVNAMQSANVAREALQSHDAVTETRNPVRPASARRKKPFTGIVGFRYEQLTELGSIMEYYEIREAAMIGEQRRFYVEHLTIAR